MITLILRVNFLATSHINQRPFFECQMLRPDPKFTGYLLQNNLPGSSLTRDFIWSLIKSSPSTSSIDSTNLAPSLISPLVPWLLGLANAPQLAKKQPRYTDYYWPIMGKYQNKGVCQLNA